jgi:DHA2 family metal-tetracycline-proton antiporter-like MFS transporter
MDNKPYSLTRNDRNLIGTLCLLFVFGNMNITMFNLAVPAISISFSLTSSQASWVMVGYSILMAIGAGTYSKLADIFSFQRLYIIGLALLATGSIMGFFATSYWHVIIGRLLQAAGASSISPLSYAIATQYFNPSVRGRVLGALSATIAFASGFGPVLGGFIEQYASWHALFLVSSLSIFIIPLIHKYVPNIERKRGSFDILGAALFSIGLTFILLGITLKWLLTLIGAVFLVGFSMHIQKTVQPFIPATFMKNVPYQRILWISFLTFIGNTGLTFVLPIMLKDNFYLPTSTIGLLILPGAFSAALLGSSIGRWTDHYGSSQILKISHWCIIAGFILMGASVQFPPWVDALWIIILMIGFNGILTASAKLVPSTLTLSELSSGMGIFTLFYLLGGSFGPAMIGRLIDLSIPFSIIYYILAFLGVLAYFLLPSRNLETIYNKDDQKISQSTHGTTINQK